jgi:glucan-binding YG repeat protein
MVKGTDNLDVGLYAAGDVVSITAETPESGKVFDTWTSEPDGVVFTNANSPTTTFAMPGNPVTVTATYTDAPPPPPAPTTYVVTVNGGTGGASYEAGATVSITANAPADGKVFDTWTSNDSVTFADPTSASTTFTMPAKAVSVTATYKDDPKDSDGDGVPDYVEEQEGTDPADSCDFKDTDEDGVPDYVETKDGTNPNDKNSFKDTNSDGIPDYVQEHPAPVTETNGWVYANGMWKFFIDDVAQTGWLYDDAWYYLDADGIMQTGWLYDGGIWYYLAGNGAMKTGWVKDDGNWYYLKGNGAMVASKWLKDTDGSWYYLAGNGKMLTGKQSIGNKAYSFKASGAWIG